ncbi:hypothetical protein [Nannocystis pusilla]|uniref:hypothetical protein n=1 Tax=Nannocystis pusilla TaxID=889268 RepID=UPI003B7CF7DE
MVGSHAQPNLELERTGARGFISEMFARSAENDILRLLGAVPLDRVDAGCFQEMKDAVEDGKREGHPRLAVRESPPHR